MMLYAVNIFYRHLRAPCSVCYLYRRLRAPCSVCYLYRHLRAPCSLCYSYRCELSCQLAIWQHLTAEPGGLSADAKCYCFCWHNMLSAAGINMSSYLPFNNTRM